MNPVTIPAKIVSVRSYLIFIIVYLTTAIALSSVIAWKLRSPYIAAVGIYVFLILLIALQKQFIKPFSQEIIIIFNEEAICIDFLNPKTNPSKTTETILLDEINAFRIYNSWKSISSTLTLTFKNGRKTRYDILEKNEAGQQEFSNSVFNFINFHNKDLKETDKIKYIRNIFTTRKGRNITLIISVLLVALIVFQVIFLPASLPVSISGSIAFLVTILVQPRKDAEQLARLNKSELI